MHEFHIKHRSTGVLKEWKRPKEKTKKILIYSTFHWLKSSLASTLRKVEEEVGLKPWEILFKSPLEKARTNPCNDFRSLIMIKHS